MSHTDRPPDIHICYNISTKCERRNTVFLGWRILCLIAEAFNTPTFGHHVVMICVCFMGSLWLTNAHATDGRTDRRVAIS